MSAIKERYSSVKARAMKLIQDLPQDSSWDDLMYRIYVRQKIEAGLADLKAGRVHRHESVRNHLPLFGRSV